MATKIEGHTTEADVSGASGIWLFRDRVTANKATLVIHGEKHERVFTESEVKAMINAMAEACDLAPIHYKVVGEHGIVLDPA